MFQEYTKFRPRIGPWLLCCFVSISFINMLPYSGGIILDSANNYGIVKTETVFGFSPRTHGRYLNDNFNSTDLEWILPHGNFERRALQVEIKSPKDSDNSTTSKEARTSRKLRRKTKAKSKIQQKSERKGKGKKCIIKMYNKGKGNKKKHGRHKHHKYHHMKKKYMMPMVLGILAAKSIIIPIALKALAFLSAKGLMMGFFSTVMASILSLKGMFEQKKEDRKDDSKTQVEIIQVPSKSEDHIYYDDHHRRAEFLPSEMVRDPTPVLEGSYGSNLNHDFNPHNANAHFR